MCAAAGTYEGAIDVAELVLRSSYNADNLLDIGNPDVLVRVLV